MDLETFKLFVMGKVKIFSVDVPRWAIAVLVWVTYLGQGVIERTIGTLVVMVIWFFVDDYLKKNKGDKKPKEIDK